jgi:hypothetical protein
MNAMRSSLLALLAACGVVMTAGDSRAQEELLGEGGYVVASFPTGDWGEVAGMGLGLDGSTYLRPNPERLLNLRNSLGLCFNFGRTVGVPSSNLAAGDKLDLETSNTSLWFGVGPELGRAGEDLRGFVFGTVGLNVYWTNSKLKGTAGGQPYEANVGHTGTVFAWSAGLGLRRGMDALPGGGVELSAEYRSGVGYKYVMPGEVTSSGSGVLWDRKSHNADQILVRLGTVFTE